MGTNQIKALSWRFHSILLVKMQLHIVSLNLMCLAYLQSAICPAKLMGREREEW